MPHNFFSFINKKIGGQMSGGSAGSATQPTSTQTNPNPPAMNDGNFLGVYECAKMNKDWYKVSNALKAHPEWLIRVPEGRRWTMLHQIVFAGDVGHLKEALGYQLDNPEFRLLHKALDNKTVREVAMDRSHINPQMIRYIERLVAGDQILSNAKDGKTQLITQVISNQKDLVNEKPPYRRHYLAHVLAAMGRLDMFKAINEISKFRLDLMVNNKSISQVARENNHQEFAEFVEHLQATEPSPPPPTTSSGASTHPQYSPGFHDDISISIIPANASFGSSAFPGSTGYSNSGHQHHLQHTGHTGVFAAHSMYQGHSPAPQSAPHPAPTHNNAGGGASATSNLPNISEEEQAAYETTIASNVNKFTGQHLLATITCCITKAILRDPVVAADGFTYEREAILEWFQHSTRSPMTNQELENLELKPNYAIRSILQSLQGVDDPSQKPKKKDPHAK